MEFEARLLLKTATARKRVQVETDIAVV